MDWHRPPLVERLQAHPQLQDLRRWMRVALDARSPYERLGWRAVARSA